ncbi:hypothetical protein J6590_066127 [Homalodisca vitripennis]|nr:hypothetical protein J6590_066127 [Homalodisca vitripennis]
MVALLFVESSKRSREQGKRRKTTPSTDPLPPLQSIQPHPSLPRGIILYDILLLPDPADFLFDLSARYTPPMLNFLPPHTARPRIHPLTRRMGWMLGKDRSPALPEWNAAHRRPSIRWTKICPVDGCFGITRRAIFTHIRVDIFNCACVRHHDTSAPDLAPTGHSAPRS